MAVHSGVRKRGERSAWGEAHFVRRANTALLGRLAAATLLRTNTITIEDMSARRDEVLADLAHGETFSVLDRGCEVATLFPRGMAESGPAADDAFYRLSDLASKSTDDGAPLSNAENGPADLCRGTRSVMRGIWRWRPSIAVLSSRHGIAIALRLYPAGKGSGLLAISLRSVANTSPMRTSWRTSAT